MARPVVTCGANQVLLHSSSPRTINLTATATESPTTWRWEMKSVPQGSSADSGANGDFTDGVATVQNPSFDIDGGVFGGYVLECTAYNGEWSDPTSDREGAQTEIRVVSSRVGFEMSNDYSYDWGLSAINPILRKIDEQMVRASSAVQHIYVDFDTGDDEKSGADWANAKATLAAAVAAIAEVANHNIVVHCRGTSSENVTINVPIAGQDKNVVFDGFDNANNKSVIVAETASTSVTATTLTKTGAGWTVNAYRGAWVRITDGAEAGNIRQIGANTADTLTFCFQIPGFSGTPNFEIIRSSCQLNGALTFYNRGHATCVVQGFDSDGTGSIEVYGGGYYRTIGLTLRSGAWSYFDGVAVIRDGYYINPDTLADNSQIRIGVHCDDSVFYFYNSSSVIYYYGITGKGVEIDEVDWLYFVKACVTKGITCYRVRFARIVDLVVTGELTAGAGIAFYDGGKLQLDSTDVSNKDEHAMVVRDASLYLNDDGGITGSGNTGAGLFADHGSRVTLHDSLTPTITGTVGDVSLDGTTQKSTWAAIAGGTPVTSGEGTYVKRNQDHPAGGGADADAIHDNVAGEIAAVTEKASPVSADLLLIEDSADSNNKKRVQVGNLPGGGSSPLTTKGDVYTFDTADARLPVGSDFQFLMADSNETSGLKWSKAVRQSAAAEQYYIDFTSGDDSNDGLSVGAPKKSWAGLYAILPDCISHDTVINLSGTTHSDYIIPKRLSVETGTTLLFSGDDTVAEIVASQTGTINGAGYIGITGAGWTTNYYRGYWIEFLSGAYNGYRYTIESNTNDRIYFLGNINPGAGVDFRIVRPSTTLTVSPHFQFSGAAAESNLSSSIQGIVAFQRLFFNGSGGLAISGGPTIKLSGVMITDYQLYVYNADKLVISNSVLDPATLTNITNRPLSISNGCGTLGSPGSYLRSYFSKIGQIYFSNSALCYRLFVLQSGYVEISTSADLFIHDEAQLSGLGELYIRTLARFVAKYTGEVGLLLRNVPYVQSEGSIEIDDKTAGIYCISGPCFVEMHNRSGGSAPTLTGTNTGFGMVVKDRFTMAYPSASSPAISGSSGDISINGSTQEATWAAISGGTPFLHVGGNVLIRRAADDIPSGGSAVDSDAIHDNVAAEISAITEKATPVSADLLLIEDSADSNNKKRVQVGNLPGGGSSPLTTKGDIYTYDEDDARLPVGTDGQVLTADSAEDSGLKWDTPTDAAAIHDDVAGEIDALTEKASPVGADVLLIEDSADSNNKKKVQITNLPGGADPNAIHDNVSMEIYSITSKSSPINDDFMLIEDYEAEAAKKRISIGDLPVFHTESAGEIDALTEKATPVSADLLLIEDSADSNNKKKVQITNLPGGTDPNAIHDNVDMEIYSITSKASPINDDFMLIEDYEAEAAKKRISIGDLPVFHTESAGEIDALTEKASPVGADVLLIEDSADSNNKKKVQITNLPGGADADAIHDNVAAEISAITEKATPVSSDLLLIEDSADSNNKKRVQVGNLPGGGSSPLTTKGDIYTYDEDDARLAVGTDGQVLTADSAEDSGLKWDTPTDATAIHDDVAGEISGLTEKATPVSSDLLLIEDSADSNNKKKVQITNLPGGTDPNAIHDNVDMEIYSITSKSSPINDDFMLIEDYEDEASKKRISIGDLPVFHTESAAEISGLAEKATPVSADLLLIEDSADSNNKKRVQVGNLPGGGSSPLTTKGDLFGYDTADARIPVGTDGQVLTADSAETLGVKWATPSGGGFSGYEDVFTATSTGQQTFTLSTNAATNANFPAGYSILGVYVNGLKQKFSTDPGTREYDMGSTPAANTVRVGGLNIDDEVEIVYGA